MKLAAIVGALALAGCAQDTWMGAAERYQCSEPQMQKVSSETLFCKKEADYSASYCYSAAIMRNCKPKRADRPTVKDAARQDGAA